MVTTLLESIDALPLKVNALRNIKSVVQTCTCKIRCKKVLIQQVYLHSHGYPVYFVTSQQSKSVHTMPDQMASNYTVIMVCCMSRHK